MLLYFKSKIQFSRCRTFHRMRWIQQEIVAKHLESLRSKRKKLEFAYSQETSETTTHPKSAPKFKAAAYTPKSSTKSIPKSKNSPKPKSTTKKSPKPKSTTKKSTPKSKNPTKTKIKLAPNATAKSISKSKPPKKTNSKSKPPLTSKSKPNTKLKPNTKQKPNRQQKLNKKSTATQPNKGPQRKKEAPVKNHQTRSKRRYAEDAFFISEPG